MRWGSGRSLLLLLITILSTPASPLHAEAEELSPPESMIVHPPKVAPATARLLPIVYILPLGSGIEREEIDFARRSLTGFYNVEVRILNAEPMPSEAWYPPRRRYRAERILDYLAMRIPRDGCRILAITSRDISTTRRDHFDWGMLGLADYDRPVCVISTFRCRARSLAAAAARIRIGKVAVHEIGHTFGLPHCGHPGCVMNDAGGKVSTCDREEDLCGRCRDHLKGRGEPLSAQIRPPWEGVDLDARQGELLASPR